MKIDAPTPDIVRQVAAQMRERDLQEFLAVSHAQDRAGLVEIITQLYGDHPGALCAGTDEPIAVGAMVEARPNVMTLLFFATDRMAEVTLPLTRFIRDRLFPRYRDHGVHRIECVSIDGYDEAHRWIEMLGLKREAVLRGFGRGGETFHQFAWVRDADPAGAPS